MTLEGSLRTARLELRPIGLGDVEALWPFVSDPELPRLMTWEAHRDRAETEGFVRASAAARAEGTGFVWSMWLEGALVGVIGLHDVVRVVRAWRLERAELGYWCGAAYRGRGLVTEAAREVLRFGFEELGLHKLTVGCASENLASKAVIERLGFRLVGVQRDHFFRFDRWWDHLSFELLLEEWRLPREAGTSAPPRG